MTAALDPLKGTNNDPLMSGRHGAAVTPSDTNDLPHVTSSLIVAVGTGGTGITVVYADDGDGNAANQTTFIPLTPGTYQLYVQVRRVMATGTTLGTGGGVSASW